MPKIQVGKTKTVLLLYLLRVTAATVCCFGACCAVGALVVYGCHCACNGPNGGTLLYGTFRRRFIGTAPAGYAGVRCAGSCQQQAGALMSEPREKRDLAAAFSDELRAFRWETHRTYIYSLVFYTCGLALGSVLYRQIRSDTVNALLRVGENRFLQLFLNDFCLYFSIFLVTVFLGFCMIGFPLIHFVPMTCGFAFGMQVCYYYMTFRLKGVLFCVLMVIPAASILLTVVMLTIKISTDMSKSIFHLSVKRDDATGESPAEIQVRDYVKKYLISAAFVALAALCNAGLTSLFSSVISI